MSHGNIQLAPQNPRGNRVITISRPQHPDNQSDGDDPLFINVLRRRWMLLTFCALLSAAAALLVISRFSLPKAMSAGQLRYVELPPTLKDTYTAPRMLEFTEILRSNEILARLARRTGQPIDPKDLRKKIRLEASRFSNIIDIEVYWRDGKQAIDLTNELMRIACETIATNRKQTLTQYAIETNLQYEAANQRVIAGQDKWFKLRKVRETQYSTEGLAGTGTESLLKKIERIENELEDMSMDSMAKDRQLTSLRGEIEYLMKSIRVELLHGRHQQVEARKKLFPPKTMKFQDLVAVEQELEDFTNSDTALDFEVWNVKFLAIGTDALGSLDPVSIAAVDAMNRKLIGHQSRIEQMEFDMLPTESRRSIFANKLQTLERRLMDSAGTADLATIAVDEAKAELDEAKAAKETLYQDLNQIRRGQETDFDEMTVLTDASWQTTETSQGKAKLFVFTFAGCFIVLVIPVFALEHFYPSGDPADNAAKSLGLPRVSRGTFVTQRLRQDRSRMHSVNSEAMRLLALRIQQSVHGPGSMVLFSGLNHERSSIPMISYLAECLARREERVLIIDACDRPQDSQGRSFNDDSVDAVMSSAQAAGGSARTGEVAQPSNGSERVAGEETLPVNVRETAQPGVLGLADFLHQRDVRPEEMICGTSIPGVDIIPSGTTSFPREGLASSSLTTLFDECRQRYTMILVAGPSTDHPSDLQMLSARADGILFTVPPNGRPAGTGEEVVQDLLDIGAPVIGIVS